MRRAVSGRLAGLGLAVGAAAGCRADHPAILRLARRLDSESVVASPLLARSDAAAAHPIAGRPVFATGFDHETAADLGWIRRNPWWGAGLEVLPDGERAWCYRGGAPESYILLLPAEPSRRYRFRRSLNTTAPALDLQILERSMALEDPHRLNAPVDLRAFRRVRRGASDALYVHHFPVPSHTGRWVQGELDLLASGRARSFAVLFSAQDEGGAGAAGAACVGELAVTQLAPSDAQELELLRTTWSAEEPGTPSGIVKRGQLLELPRLVDADGPLEGNLAHLDVLFAPTPTVLRFPLRVPEHGRLTLAHGLARTARRGDRATFEVLVEEPDGATHEIFAAERHQTGPYGAPWQEAEVALDRWANRRVALVLRTEGPADRPVHAVWGNPIVDRPRRPREPPNIVLIGIDTLRADAVSSYGSARPTTPHLDRLALEGVRFADVVTVAPWTAPSFASIFTGLMPSRHGVVDRLTPLAEALTTLPERLRDAGWRTQAVAYKSFLYNLGFEQGFDEWLNVPRGDRNAADVATRAAEFLTRHHDRRFFLFLHLDDPHQPMRMPPAFLTRFAAPAALERFDIALPLDLGLWPWLECQGCRSRQEIEGEYRALTRAVYDGAVAFLDDRIGSVLAALRAHDVYEETLIAVVSDHGETLWDLGHAFGHGGMRQEVLRAVMMIKPPGESPIEPGTVVAARVRTTDLAPTLLELAGLDPGPPSAESRSLVALARGRERGRDPVAVSENPGARLIAVRHGDWKYVTEYFPESIPRQELYDLASDPGERINRAGDEPERLAELHADLLDHVLRNRAGSYLVALGDGRPRSWEVEVGGAAGPIVVQVLAGPRPLGVPAERRTFALSTGARLLVLAELGVPGGESLEAVLRADGVEVARLAAQPFTPLPPTSDAVRRLLRRPGPALHLIAVPAPASAPPPAVESAENLEQLRALGYIE